MPRDIAWEVMNRLGSEELVHFESTIINYENPFTRSLKRCDETMNRLLEVKRFIEEIRQDFKLVETSYYKQAMK